MAGQKDPHLSSPREVWEQAHRFVKEYDLGAFATMFASDGVMEWPFAPAGMPKHIQGRANIRRMLEPLGERSRQSGRRILDYRSIVVHETAEPEVIIVEFDLIGEVEATNQRYTLSYIQVVRVRNGEIIFLRDYMDSLALSALPDASRTQR